ncbi:MAG: 5-formyltetrahydrofolate cyclo-ligase [Firmicutes bacterium]|nr:5-formyltetrahydrofolate cyclo-ligase [Bacillota bacterium]
MEEKKRLRKIVKAKREQLTWQQVEAYSEKIAAQLFALPEYRAAQTVMYFLSFGKEVKTLKMVPETFAHGKRVVVPKTVREGRQLLVAQITNLAADLTPGPWNIPEPKVDKLPLIDPKEIDFVVTPGLAFDEYGNRLGYGAGYYDRFFPRLRPGVPLVALAFELQILDKIPVEPWDKQVDMIITEKRVIRSKKLY